MSAALAALKAKHGRAPTAETTPAKKATPTAEILRLPVVGGGTAPTSYDEWDDQPDTGNEVATPADTATNGTTETALDGAERFAFIESGCQVYDTKTDQLLSLADFRALTANYPKVEVGESKKAWADAWLTSKDRPQYLKLIYNPGYTGSEHLNRWKGWPYQPKQGDVSPYLDIVDHVVGADRARKVLQWFAYPLQNPGKRALHSLVFVSEEHGVGKGLMVKTAGKLHGEGYKTPNPAMVTGDFNGWLSKCSFAVCEEFSVEGNRKLMPRLKELITEPEVMINEKNQPAYMADNLACFVFNTNDHAALHIELKDRRFDVMECTEKPLKPEFYDRFIQWRDNGGMEALMHYLLHLDMTGFNPHGHAPKSDDKEAMAELTMTDLERWLRDFGITANKAVWTTNELRQRFENYSNSRTTETAVARALRRLGMSAKTRLSEGERPRVFAIRDNDKWKKAEAAAWADEYAIR